MNRYLLLFFGYGATFLKAISFIPQVYQIMRTNDTRGLSLSMYLLLVILMIFWIIYASNKDEIDYPILLANSIALIFVLYIILKIIGNSNTIQEQKYNLL